MGWESLPSELIQLLCEWLPFGKAVRLNEVCSLWKAVLDDETLWRRLYSGHFGPLSSCHLTIPLPPHFRSGAITPTKVLKWKKRFTLMRHLAIRSSERGSNMTWPLLHGCARLVLKRGYFDSECRPDVAMSALLVDDIKLLKWAIRCDDNMFILGNDSSQLVRTTSFSYFLFNRLVFEGGRGCMRGQT